MMDEDAYVLHEITEIITRLMLIEVNGSRLFYRIDEKRIDQDTIEVVMHQTRSNQEPCRMTLKLKGPYRNGGPVTWSAT